MYSRGSRPRQMLNQPMLINIFPKAKILHTQPCVPAYTKQYLKKCKRFFKIGATV